jgi:hypothetical protein
MHADHGIRAHLQRLLLQTVKRALPRQVPGVGQDVQLPDDLRVPLLAANLGQRRLGVQVL